MSDKSDEESVLGSLPDTRPTRFGARAAREPKADDRDREADGGEAASRRRPRRRPRRGQAARRHASPARVRGRPRPRSLASRRERARTAEPPPESTTSPPSGTELVTTAIQAAGELAQIGLAVGGQVLKRAVDKLPKP